MPTRESYRTSHASAGYGEIYETTYRQGYELAQWTQLEIPMLHDLFRTLSDAGARRLLDFACGTGRILAVAEEFFPTTWGVDVSDAMLGITQRRCRQSTIVKQDLTVQPLAERFDVVTAFRFFLGAEPALRSQALDVIATLLDRNGVLIANIHVNSTSPLGIAYRIADTILPSREADTMGFPEFETLLRTHGFRVRDVRRYGYLPRTGPWLMWLPKYAMRPVEAACRRVPLVRTWMAQSFLVVCERATAGTRV